MHLPLLVTNWNLKLIDSRDFLFVLRPPSSCLRCGTAPNQGQPPRWLESEKDWCVFYWDTNEFKAQKFTEVYTTENSVPFQNKPLLANLLTTFSSSLHAASLRMYDLQTHQTVHSSVCLFLVLPQDSSLVCLIINRLPDRCGFICIFHRPVHLSVIFCRIFIQVLCVLIGCLCYLVYLVS